LVFQIGLYAETFEKRKKNESLKSCFHWAALNQLCLNSNRKPILDKSSRTKGIGAI